VTSFDPDTEITAREALDRAYAETALVQATLVSVQRARDRATAERDTWKRACLEVERERDRAREERDAERVNRAAEQEQHVRAMHAAVVEITKLRNVAR